MNTAGCIVERDSEMEFNDLHIQPRKPERHIGTANVHRYSDAVNNQINQ